jgi:hypothetical protein
VRQEELGNLKNPITSGLLLMDTGKGKVKLFLSVISLAPGHEVIWGTKL